MKAKETSKDSGRVIFVTILLAVLTIALGVLTGVGRFTLKSQASTFSALTNTEAPQICFSGDYENDDGYVHTGEGAYVCSIELDDNLENVELGTSKDYALFLQNQTIFASEVISWELVAALTIVGVMLTLCSGVATLAYWFHNR